MQVEESFVNHSYHRKRIGLNHNAFHAKSRDHVNYLNDQLESMGIEILYKDKYPFGGGKRHYALYVEDPNPIKVEVVAPTHLKISITVLN